ncbi:MAG: SBBP repeat-containing protein, partial [Lewinellaceae bacterium]|nr:SBBP repeat-containing protein [Lewinellaceae bacterium]
MSVFSCVTDVQAQSLDWAFSAPAPVPQGVRDICEAVARDALGNMYVTGSFLKTADFDPGPGTANLSTSGSNQDIFVAKYDASGAYQWAFNIGSSSDDSGLGIAIDGSGDVLVTGRFGGTADFDPGPGAANLTSMGSDDIFVAKYDASGAYLWAFPIGDAGSDFGYSIATDGLDNVLVTGRFQGAADFDPGPGTTNLSGLGNNDIFVAKYDASGAYQWAGQVGRYANDGLEVENQAVATDAWGNCYITGFFEGTADFDPGPGTAELSTTGDGDEDVFIAKYDASGAYQWAFKIGSSSNNEIGDDITIDGVGNVLVMGVFDGTVDFDPGPGTALLTCNAIRCTFVAKYAPSGAYLQAFSMMGLTEGLSITSDGSNNVLVTGRFNGAVDFDPGPGTANLTSAGNSDIFVAKYDVSGAYQWAFNIGDAGFGSGYAITVDDSDNVLVAGSFEGAADFDPGPGTANLSSAAGDSDIFVAKYSASGAYQWAFSIGGPGGSDDGRDIAVDGLGNVLLTGYIRSLSDFDPGPGTTIVASVNASDGFLAKYASCPPSGVFYVNDNASGANTGASWADAFNNLQDALTQAAACPNVDEIWVAAGTYTPGQGVGYIPGNRSHSFVMRNNLAIYGGFPGLPGQEGDLSVRDWAAYETTLSGDIDNDGTLANNSYHVIFNNNLNNTAVLDGFTVSGGNADGGGANNFGGGMYNNNSSPVVANSTFTGNSANNNGGGMHNETDSSPTVANCTFTGNSANGHGGGMHNESGSSPALANCAFSGNLAGSGGGMYNYTCSPTLANCTFSGNSAGAGGGMYNYYFSGPTLDNCILWGNSSSISNELSSTATVAHSIVQGGYSPCANCPNGDGNADPLFVSQPPIGLGITGNLRLQACSPAIDAGDNGANTTSEDLAGNPRVVDASGSATVDMGAYEFQGMRPNPAPVCQNITVQLGPDNTVTVLASQLNDGSTGCGPLSFLIDGQASLSFDCGGLGQHTATLTVTDAFGSQANCNATITVADDDNPCCAAPAAACKPFTAVLDAGGSATLTAGDVDGGSTYACGLQSIAASPNTFSCADAGPQTVTLTVTDVNNESSSCNAQVTVKDEMPPVARCRNRTIELNAAGSATLTAGQVNNGSSDNCGLLGLSLNRTSFGCADVGMRTVLLTATDGAGNSHSCVSTVTVRDNTDPEALCQNATIQLG